MDIHDTLHVRARDIRRWYRDLVAMRAAIDGMLQEISEFLPKEQMQPPAPTEVEKRAEAEPPAEPKAPAQDEPKPVAEEVSEAELAHQAKRLLAEHRMRNTVKIASRVAEKPEKQKKKVKSRVSFGSLCRRIGMEHGAETLKYAIDLCGVDRTATRLKQVMENFLGVYRTNVDAGRAYCTASGIDNASDADAVAALADAIHKVSVQGRGLAVWSNDRKQMRRQQPGEVTPGQRDPSHAWHKMVEQTQKADTHDEDDHEAEAQSAQENGQTMHAVSMGPQRLSDDDIAAFC